MLTKATIDDFKKQITFSQSQALKDVEQGFSSIMAKNSAKGCLRSGATIKAMGRLASSRIDKFSDETIATALEFSSQLNLPLADMVCIIRNAIEQLKRKYVTSQPVLTLDVSIEHLSVPQHILKLLDDAVERANMRCKKVELGLRQSKEPNGISVSHNTLNVEQMHGHIQQGSHSIFTISSSPINHAELSKAIQEFETKLQSLISQDSTHKLTDIQTDIETIKLQLNKPEPSEIIINETIKSLKNIIEGGLGGVLANQLTPLIPPILTAIGL